MTTMINGKTIKKIRAQMNLTQEKFAKGLGVNVTTLARWERDEVKLSGTTKLLFQRMLEEATDA